MNNDFKGSVAVVQVGDDEGSTAYAKAKRKDCEREGIEFYWYWFDENVDIDELVEDFKEIQAHVSAVLVEQPLPPGVEAALAEVIDPEKDIDGLGVRSKFKPRTAQGIVDYLEGKCGLSGKHVAVIGRGKVGRPLAQMLIDADATVTLCHSKTKGLDRIIDLADIIVCAVGKPKFLNCYPIYKPVVDVGINIVDGKIVGDCFNTKDRDVTPVPGGVGLMTRKAFLDAVAETAKKGRPQ